MNYTTALFAYWKLFAFALAASLLSMQVLAQSSQVDFYVSPKGDDAYPGTLEKPFATLQRARDAVRELKTEGLDRDILVQIRGGEYRLESTVVFSLQDSAPKGHTISYSAYPGEKPIFTSGLEVKSWEKVDEEIKGLPSKAAGKIWKAKCPDDVENFYTLYHGYERLPRARTKGFKPTSKSKTYKIKNQNRMLVPKGAIQQGQNLKDWELFAITAAPWTMNILSVKSIDNEASALKTIERGSYALTQPRFGEFPRSAWIENSFSGLDEPGEWVFDSEAKAIYLWPRKGKNNSKIMVPNLTELIRVEGSIDYEGPQDQPVRGLVFEGLTFTRADRYKWDKSGRGFGLQHDWEVFDAPTAMVRFRGAENCVVQQCRFVNSGATAIRLDLHCQNNKLNGNEIRHVGGTGIALAGYGPGIKDVNHHNQITNNHIHDVGELYWHSPGIIVWQSGENLIANNLIHHMPYTGIVVSGRIVWRKEGDFDCIQTIRWKEIENVFGDKHRGLDWKTREPYLHARNNHVFRNDLHHLMQVMSDGNGIYISGAGGGNLIQENYIHDCPSNLFLQGIRCDDDQHETTIDRNIIWRIGGWAEFILIKGKNDVTGNICAMPLQPPKRGMLVLKPTEPDGTDGSLIQQNIFYSSRKGDNLVGEVLEGKGKRARLHNCEVDKNLYFNSADANWGRQHLQAAKRFGSEPNSIAVNPRFKSVSKGNFELRKNSPLGDIGFEPIDISLIGINDSEK